MASNTKKSWSEVNKIRKQERRKWKDQNLAKKLKKEAKEATSNIQQEIKQEVNSIPTISIAVPGSILENAQSPELCTYLAGQIARAACIFQVDEIVVFDDYGDETNAKKSTLEQDRGVTVSARKCCVQLGRILQYLECPQYLRKHFFPIHPDLRFCGLLNPLNAPHHLKPDEHFEFREGVVSNKPVKNAGSYVNIGLLNDAHVDKSLVPGIRCTVKLLPTREGSKKIKGMVVPPDAPRRETGTYWGYMVRIATSLSKVFTQSLYKDGYDLTLGTSDKGTSIDECTLPPYKHLLIVFGGVQGLEAAIENDPTLDTDDPSVVFDHYLNVLPEQGSKTIRTEEAILISLAALRSKIKIAKMDDKFGRVAVLSVTQMQMDYASREKNGKLAILNSPGVGIYRFIDNIDNRPVMVLLVEGDRKIRDPNSSVLGDSWIYQWHRQSVHESEKCKKCAMHKNDIYHPDQSTIKFGINYGEIPRGGYRLERTTGSRWISSGGISEEGEERYAW